MTVAARTLTDRARPPARPPAVLTEPAGTARAYLEILGRLGYDKAALTLAAGLDRLALDDPDERVPCEAIGRLFAHAIATRPLKNFGMRLAMETPLGAFPLIDYLVVSSETVGQGLERLAQYYRLVASAVVLRVTHDVDRVRVTIDGGPSPLRNEFVVTLCLRHLHRETNGVCAADAISFMHVPEDSAEMQRVLGCPGRHEGFDGWTFSRPMWDLPMSRRDAALRGLLERQATDLLLRMPAGAGVASAVRRALVERVTGGDARIDAVARALALSPRSLQRRLSEEGVSYSELVDAARQSIAEQQLRQSSLSIGEIAFLLGYSEPAAFHRAFRRWTGVTPQSFRARGTAPQSVAAPR